MSKVIKVFVFLFLFFFSQIILAGETTKQGESEPLETQLLSSPSGRITFNPEDFGANSKCNYFIKSDGSLGLWGKILESAINRVGQDCFFNKVDFSFLCPDFKEFNKTRKMQFIAFLFASIAHYESSCSPKKTNAKATNGRADGLLQLEYSFRLRKQSGRDLHFCKTYEPTDTQKINFQMECGASIFHNRFCKPRRGRYFVPVKDISYWSVLNGENKKATLMAQKFPYCK